MTYLAPLVGLIAEGNRTPNFVLWVYGLTGSRKTSASLAFLNHFGNFSSNIPPASFKDTANAIELKAHTLKDSLLLIDDYHPNIDGSDARKLPRGSPAAWASTPSSRSPCAAAPSFNSPSSFFSSLMPSRLSSLRRYCSPYGITMTWASPEATGTVSSAVRTRRRPRSSTPVAVPSKVAVPAASSMRTARPVRKDEPS